VKSASAIIATILATTQAFWMIESAHSQPSEHGKPGKLHKASPQKNVQNHPHDNHRPQYEMPMREAMRHPENMDSITIGSYFQEHHHRAAQAFYERPENTGYCPPGLAKKGGDCLPPGQARKWQRGHPLPVGVRYYDVPRSVVLTLGVPPAGYRYVRVASDILLITVGTNLVIDAIEDLVH